MTTDWATCGPRATICIGHFNRLKDLSEHTIHMFKPVSGDDGKMDSNQKPAEGLESHHCNNEILNIR